MDKYNNLLQLSNEAYQESYKAAVKCYNEQTKDIINFDKNQLIESEMQPMHPNMYYQLITICGFCDLNGNNYDEYLDKWKTRKINTIKIQPTKLENK